MFRNTSTFDRLLEKATSPLLLDPDWQSTLAITDLIRGGEVTPKHAVSAIKKKFYHENPHVAFYGLMVMESCVKNCGSLVHEEVATKQFMEELRELVKQTNDEKLKTKVLEMIQNWGMAFRNSPKYRIVTDTLNLMKAEGWEFPPVREAEAMFEADVAPDWADGEVCHRCRTQFGLMTRQHHCRACGQVFCSKCSSKTCLLPKFGIEKEVRVCDSCYVEHGPKDGSTSNSEHNSPLKVKKTGMNQQENSRSHQPQSGNSSQQPGMKTDAEIKEEEELQLAIALSKSEAEEKEKSKLRSTSQILNQSNIPEQKLEVNKTNSSDDYMQVTPELMRYLNRDYWDQKEAGKQQIAKQANQKEVEPVGNEKMTSTLAEPVNSVHMAAPINSAEENNLNEFVTTLKTQVEIFVNRMKSNSSRGRSISNDSSVQTLFMNTMAMHSQLLKYIQEQEDKRVYYEGLQDRITAVKDARAALDSLREEEQERKRREAEEAERQRQIQMQEKLEVMRKKKQEYLQYQRQVALQRMQEQERELLLRQEQAKQQFMMSPHQMVPGAMAPGMITNMGTLATTVAPGMYLPPQGYGMMTQTQAGYGMFNADPSMQQPPSYQSVMGSDQQALQAPLTAGGTPANPTNMMNPNLALQQHVPQQQLQPSVPGAVVGGVPSAVPGTIPSAVPGTVSSAVPGTVPSAVPGSIPSAISGTIPSAVPGTIPNAVSGTVTSAVSGAVAPTADSNMQPGQAPTSQPQQPPPPHNNAAYNMQTMASALPQMAPPANHVYPSSQPPNMPQATPQQQSQPAMAPTQQALGGPDQQTTELISFD